MTATLTGPVPDLTKPLPYATFSITVSRAAELAAEGQLVPWQGVLAVEGVPTGDRRVIELGALRWANLPLPLMAQFENPVGGQGHDGAVLAGRIDDIVRIDDNRVWARGFIDPKSPGGATLINALDMGLMRGISVDLDDVTVTQFRDKAGNSQRGITNGRIRGATVTPFQAIVEAEISLDVDSLTAAAGTATLGNLARITTPISGEESIIERLEQSLVASGGKLSIPVDPPLAFFEKRQFTELTPFTILPNGQVFGHIAAWGTCHISFRKCEPVPRSKTNYSEFRTGSVVTSDGVTVRTGPLIMDSVHPDLMMRASDAQAFYAHTGSAMADIIPYEDKFGIAVVGAIRPDVTAQQLRALRGSDVSPDWRTVNGHHRECVAMLAVNNSGFKVPQALVASGGEARHIMPGGVAAAIDPDGELLTLVASGGALTIDPGCDDDLDNADETEIAEWRTESMGLIVERWGPKVRTFRMAIPPKVRTFRTAQFHAQHDQKSHGNRAGAGKATPQDLHDRDAAKVKENAGVHVKDVGEHLNDWVQSDSNTMKRELTVVDDLDDGVFEVTIEANVAKAEDIGPVKMSGGKWGAKITVHNIGGPDGVTITTDDTKDPVNVETAEEGKRMAVKWARRNLEGVLAADDPDTYEPLAASIRTFRTAQFHAQHDQKSHGNRAGATGGSDAKPTFDAPSPKKPKGGGDYQTDTTADGRNYSGHPVPGQNAHLIGSTRLMGAGWRMTEFDGDPKRFRTGDEMDGVEPDVMLVQTQSGRQRAFIKPTGKIVRENRTRPSLYEYDQFEVDTVARTNDSGKTSVVGVPGKFVQKLYANSETVQLRKPLD